MWLLILVVQQYYIIPLIHLFCTNISGKETCFRKLKIYRLLKFIGMYQTKNNVSKKWHRYTHKFNIMLSSEMLVWNCFRLLTAQFTTMSFTMTLKGEITIPAKNGHHGGHFVIIICKPEYLTPSVVYCIGWTIYTGLFYISNIADTMNRCLNFGSLLLLTHRINVLTRPLQNYNTYSKPHTYIA